MKFALLLLPALLLAGDPAWALEIYCDISGKGRVYPDGHFERLWMVVHPSARKVQMPGQTKPTTSCSVSYNSVSAMYRPIEIIKAPQLGTAEVLNTYRVVYRPSKLGSDDLVIKIFWNRRGVLAEATVRYNIQVVDQPL
jgi:hypothetical protein